MRGDRSRLTRAVLALCLAFVLAAADVHASNGVTRLGAPGTFAFCTLAGESRPGSSCATPLLLAAHKGRRIPADGRLVVSLDPLAHAAAGFGLQIEAYVYARVPAAALIRRTMQKLHKILTDTRRPGLLNEVLGESAAFRRAPHAPLTVATKPPETITLQLPAAAAGQRVIYAIWAWPLAPSRVEMPLQPILSGSRLALAAGVQAAEAVALAPVAFEATLLDPATERPVVSLWRRTLNPTTQSDVGWQDETVDLTAWIGGTYRLRLEAHPTGGAATGHLGTWARPLLQTPTSRRDDRPNVLLLSIDTLRADHVGAYGQKRNTTPRLDQLAATATVFEQVYSPFPSTTASHISMLTSLQPCAHGVTLPDQHLDASIPTLPELLAAHGYATVGITEDGLIKGDAGFNRGFDRYRDLHPDTTVGSFHTGIALAEQWLAGDHGSPFFMFLHTYQVHHPYKIPAHLRGLFSAPADAPEWERHQADYDVGLRHADELLGGFLDFLAERKLLEHMVLIITSDHGTEFGERGGIGHARGVHVEQLHVPLILYYAPLKGGVRVANLAGVLDIPPTVLELVGLEPLPSFTGQSLVPLLRRDIPSTRVVVGEQLWGPRQTSLRDGTHTWIMTTAGTAVYDSAADPWEQHDLVPHRAELAAQGGRAIAEFRSGCSPGHDVRVPSFGAVDPERSRALKSLGYIQ